MYQQLVSFQYWTFIAQLCNFFIQIWLFKKFLFKPVKNIIEQRQQKLNSILVEAQDAKDTAVATKKEYEDALRDARQEAKEITEQAIVSAKTRSEQILSETKDDVAAIRKKASNDIELERQKAMAQAKNDISTLAVELAAKIVNKEIDENTHKDLIDDFIKDLGEA
ncbi:MAG: F0F1 ATP synthase subunit B [Clostridia bacterium]|nr:F0F1 ATP synthase subunit B [Clostridia bacterium]